MRTGIDECYVITDKGCKCFLQFAPREEEFTVRRTHLLTQNVYQAARFDTIEQAQAVLDDKEHYYSVGSFLENNSVTHIMKCRFIVMLQRPDENVNNRIGVVPSTTPP